MLPSALRASFPRLEEANLFFPPRLKRDFFPLTGQKPLPPSPCYELYWRLLTGWVFALEATSTPSHPQLLCWECELKLSPALREGRFLSGLL